MAGAFSVFLDSFNDEDDKRVTKLPLRATAKKAAATKTTVRKTTPRKRPARKTAAA